eukprot:g18304.t2
MMIREHSQIAFACPSFDKGSDGVWRFFDGHDPRWKLRYTNFVECTAPVLKSSMLLDARFQPRVCQKIGGPSSPAFSSPRSLAQCPSEVERLQSISKSADEAWMMWDGHQKGFPVLLQPVALLPMTSSMPLLHWKRSHEMEKQVPVIREQPDEMDEILSDVCSPKWAAPMVRRASNRLVMEGDDCDRSFVEICGRVQSLMDQTVMRVLKFMSRIRDCHKEAPEMLLEPDNFERLSSIGYMVATVNYRISKWLHQLQPREYLKPMKPTESHFRERTVEELLRDVNFALSRSSVLASDLAPKLRKILGESSRGPKAKPEFLLDEPNSLSAGCNLEQVARRHGITDVQEIQGLVGHLERLLEVSHALAFRPAPSKDVTLPREAVLWTISEVDIYLGSLGFIRPSRESSLMRSSKRLVRALRGGYKPLEFRVDQSGKDSGVFSSIDVEKGDLVELCPLHEVPAHLRAISKVLQRITVPMQCDASRFAIMEEAVPRRPPRPFALVEEGYERWGSRGQKSGCRSSSRAKDAPASSRQGLIDVGLIDKHPEQGIVQKPRLNTCGPSKASRSPSRSSSRDAMANWSSRSLRRGLSFSEAWRLASSRKLPSTPGLVRTSEGLGRPGAGFSFWTEKQRVALDGQYLRHNSKVPWSFDQSSRTQRARTSCWSLDTSFRTSPEQWLREEAHSKGDYVDFWAIKQPQTWTWKSPLRLEAEALLPLPILNGVGVASASAGASEWYKSRPFDAAAATLLSPRGE